MEKTRENELIAAAALSLVAKVMAMGAISKRDALDVFEVVSAVLTTALEKMDPTLAAQAEQFTEFTNATRDGDVN